MDKIEEIIARVLDLEKAKNEIQDIIPWKAEIPRQKALLDEITKELHALRAELAELKAGPKPNKPGAEKSESEGNEEAVYGFF